MVFRARVFIPERIRPEKGAGPLRASREFSNRKQHVARFFFFLGPLARHLLM
jgi:hypothetical protein